MNANLAVAVWRALWELNLNRLSATTLSVWNSGPSRRTRVRGHTSLSTTHVVVELQIDVDGHGNIERSDGEALSSLARE
jgi:hypothetical protein